MPTFIYRQYLTNDINGDDGDGDGDGDGNNILDMSNNSRLDNNNTDRSNNSKDHYNNILDLHQPNSTLCDDDDGLQN